MARRLYPTRARAVRDNPRILGMNVSIEDLLMKAGGAFLTAAANDKFVSPVLRRMLPGWNDSKNAVLKAVDAGTTLLSAIFVTKAAGMVGASQRIADNLFEGGGILAGGRAYSIVSDQFSLNAEYPTPSALAEIAVGAFRVPAAVTPPANSAQLPAPAALPAGIGL